jgi:hypothetical protein
MAAGMTPATAEVVEELTRLYRDLPPRPAVEEVEAAAAVLASADAEEEARLAEIAREEARARARAAADRAPAELVAVLAEARRNAVRLRALQQRKEAAHVLDLEKRFEVFDNLVRKASRVVEGGGAGPSGATDADKVLEVEATLAAAAVQIDRGTKAGLGTMKSKAVSSSLRRAASAGILRFRFLQFRNQILAQFRPTCIIHFFCVGF